MKAIILNDSCLNQISKLSKDFIKDFNNKNSILLIPKFPLWAFYDENFDESIFERVSKVYIDSIITDNSFVYFELKLEDKNSISKMKIQFAESIDNTKIEDFISDFKFEILKIKSFRIGNVSFSNNTYDFFDEKWITCKE